MRRKTRHFLLLKHDQNLNKGIFFSDEKGNKHHQQLGSLILQIRQDCQVVVTRVRDVLNNQSKHRFSRSISCQKKSPVTSDWWGYLLKDVKSCYFQVQILKKRVWRVQEAPFVFGFFFSITIRLNCFLKACC